MGKIVDLQQAAADAARVARTITGPGGFKLLSPAAIWAPIEEPKCLVEGVIRRASVTQLVAYGSSGKSWLAVDMMLSVATGGKWLDRFECSKGKSTILDYESGDYEIRRRLHAVAKARGITHPVEGIDACVMPDVYMCDTQFGKRVATLAKERDLIVLDTLKAANPGVDENDSNIRVGIDHMRRAADATGCAFLVLVHAKKVSGSVVKLDAREAGRGSSAIFDAADTVLHVSYQQGKPLLIQQTKSRLGRNVDPFQVHIEDTEDGGVRVVGEDAPATESHDAQQEFWKLCDDVLEVVKAHPGASGRMIRAQVKGRAQNTLAALEHLERNGALRNGGTASAAKWYPTGRVVREEDPWADIFS